MIRDTYLLSLRDAFHASSVTEEETFGFTFTETIKAYLGTGKLGVRKFISNPYSLHCHHQNDSALIKVGRCVSHFNVSLIVGAKSQDIVHDKRQFLKRRERRTEARATVIMSRVSGCVTIYNWMVVSNHYCGIVSKDCGTYRTFSSMIIIMNVRMLLQNGH